MVIVALVCVKSGAVGLVGSPSGLLATVAVCWRSLVLARASIEQHWWTFHHRRACNSINSAKMSINPDGFPGFEACGLAIELDVVVLRIVLQLCVHLQYLTCG